MSVIQRFTKEKKSVFRAGASLPSSLKSTLSYWLLRSGLSNLGHATVTVHAVQKVQGFLSWGRVVRAGVGVKGKVRVSQRA